MKLHLRLASLLVALCLLCSCGASPEREISHLVRRLETSYNDMDVDGILDCLEPSMANVLESALTFGLGLAGSLSGFDLGDMDAQFLMDFAKVYYDTLPESERAMAQQEVPQLSIELEEIQVDEDRGRAQAVATLSFEDGNGQQVSETCLLYFTCIDEEWYLSNQNFQGMFS